MPFKRIIPHPFLPAAIRTYAPALSGVYGISSALEWIYIGEADDIRDALLRHLQDPASSLMKRHPTGFVFEVCEQAARLARRDRLVQEYGPCCNHRV